MANDRPRIRIQLTKSDIILEISALVLLLALVIYSLVSWTMLPETIPVHFDISGRPDGWGGRATIFFSPAILAVVYIMLTVLNRSPHIFNYPVKITAENAEFHYRLATRMLRMLKLSMVILFGAITWGTVHSAISGDASAMMWVLPFALIITLLPIVYYLFRAFGHKTAADKNDREIKNKRKKNYKLY
ncbi:MAG: DUF1648 domain-containing protein [Bacteroidetes bacterium]|nr:DUF1648 domain-containing protein [Bacteroidota bacterium]